MGRYLTAIQRREKDEHDRVIRIIEQDVLAQAAACRAAARADNRVSPPGVH